VLNTIYNHEKSLPMNTLKNSSRSSRNLGLAKGSIGFGHFKPGRWDEKTMYAYSEAEQFDNVYDIVDLTVDDDEASEFYEPDIVDEGETGDVVDSDDEDDEDEEKPKKGGKRKKQDSNVSNYVLTIPADSVTLQDLVTFLKSECRDYIFQLEEGQGELNKFVWNKKDEKVFDLEKLIASEEHEVGYKHYQAFIHLKKKIRWSQLKDKCPKVWHIEKCDNIKAAKKYCSKKSSRIGKTHIWDVEDPEVDEMNDVILKDWQQEIVDIISEKPDDRTIHWIYDKHGNHGKSFLCKYINRKFEGVYLGMGKPADVIFALAAGIKEFKKEPKIILIDIPRSEGASVDFGLLEQLKGGFVFSGKYESGAIDFNPPHVIVFSNFYPKVERLTIDRWQIYQLTDRWFKNIFNGKKVIKDANRDEEEIDLYGDMPHR